MHIKIAPRVVGANRASSYLWSEIDVDLKPIRTQGNRAS